jgi:hypothetical protein
MYVAEFLDAFAFRADIEVVIAQLPKGFNGFEMTGDGLLEGLDCLGQRLLLRFCHKEMDMFRHDDIAKDIEVVTSACLFERGFKASTG